MRTVMGPPNHSFQPNFFIHRWFFYRVSERGSSIVQKICISSDILWQLPCSGTRQNGHLYKRYKRVAPYVVPGFIVEVKNFDFPGYCCVESAPVPGILVLHGYTVNILKTVYNVWWVTPSATRETPCLEVTGSSEVWNFQFSTMSKCTIWVIYAYIS